MSPGLAARLAASPRGRVAALLGGVGLVTLLALSPGPLAAVAARAALAVAALAVVAVLVRGRPRSAGAPVLAVLARAPLAGGAGIALVEADGRRLLLGFGRDGVVLVAELGAPPEALP